jgi:hypothetical protein
MSTFLLTGAIKGKLTVSLAATQAQQQHLGGGEERAVENTASVYQPLLRLNMLAPGPGTCRRRHGRARRLHGGEPRHAAPPVSAALAEERIREESTEGEEKKREKSAADMWAPCNFLFFFSD